MGFGTGMRWKNLGDCVSLIAKDVEFFLHFFYFISEVSPQISCLFVDQINSFVVKLFNVSI